jgi:DMSO/TMAO reductase YedYZ molybdopterin-dependent catalytic subunit
MCFGDCGEGASMSTLLTRRTLVTAGLVSTAGAAGLGAAQLAGRYGLIPPDHAGLFGIGESLTYSAQRLLTASQPLAREFPSSAISKTAPVNGPAPKDETYRRLLAGGFADWRLTVDGLVARPSSFSLEQLKRLPPETHTTLHACEEGWSYIAQWSGVRLSHILQMVQPRPQARYVVFVPFANPNQHTGFARVLWDSLDMADALHPQTLLAYAMNGQDLPADHGAPVRLRVARQLGYKNTKYLARLIVTDSMDHFGKRVGSRSAEGGNAWYGGI